MAAKFGGVVNCPEGLPYIKSFDPQIMWPCEIIQ